MNFGEDRTVRIMRICTRSKLCQTERLTVLARAQTTRVVLVKACENKANPATDEVRVGNRNHGVAGSCLIRKGNTCNRTFTIQKLLQSNHNQQSWLSHNACTVLHSWCSFRLKCHPFFEISIWNHYPREFLNTNELGPSPSIIFWRSFPLSRGQLKRINPVPRAFFALKPNGNACDAG